MGTVSLAFFAIDRRTLDIFETTGEHDGIDLVNLAESRGWTLRLCWRLGNHTDVRRLRFVRLAEEHDLLIISRHQAASFFVLFLKMLAPSQCQWFAFLAGALHFFELLTE